MRITSLLLVWGVVLLSLPACKQKEEPPCMDPINPLCPNYDPCYGQWPLSADFLIEEEVGFFRPGPYQDKYGYFKYPTDTACHLSPIHFAAPVKADRYEWRVGSDARVWTDSAFALNFFSSEPLGGFSTRVVPVELRVYREQKQSCYPYDSVKVMRKNLTIVPREQTAMLGTYQGKSTRFPEQPFAIEFRYGAITHGAGVDNLPYDCHSSYPSASIDTNLTGSPIEIGYRAAISGQFSSEWGDSVCYPMQAVFLLDSAHHKIYVEYTLYNEGYRPKLDTTDFIYEGYKVY